MRRMMSAPLLLSSDDEDDTADGEEVLPNEGPQLEGPDRVAQMAVNGRDCYGALGWPPSFLNGLISTDRVR